MRLYELITPNIKTVYAIYSNGVFTPISDHGVEVICGKLGRDPLSFPLMKTDIGIVRVINNISMKDIKQYGIEDELFHSQDYINTKSIKSDNTLSTNIEWIHSLDAYNKKDRDIINSAVTVANGAAGICWSDELLRVASVGLKCRVNVDVCFSTDVWSVKHVDKFSRVLGSRTVDQESLSHTIDTATDYNRYLIAKGKGQDHYKSTSGDIKEVGKYVEAIGSCNSVLAVIYKGLCKPKAEAIAQAIKCDNIIKVG